MVVASGSAFDSSFYIISLLSSTTVRNDHGGVWGEWGERWLQTVSTLLVDFRHNFFLSFSSFRRCIFRWEHVTVC